jgi:anion-transporting  ArsA/GET3 family ATPase
MSDLPALLLRHRAVVCVGTGGVGKTTIAASLALAAAILGRRAMVLTIDPARQLARALGLAALGPLGEAVAIERITARGTLHAAMLDQKAAWDAFITRHAPSKELRATLLDNRFYRQLSSSFAGSSEFMAIEELCRLDESGKYDLIVIDTPPASHAVDFLRAPERIERLLDPEVSGWLSRPYRGGTWQSVSGAVELVLRRLERALGTRTLREVRAFFIALEALFGDVAARALRARALLRGPETAFVLVVGPMEREIAGALELVDAMHTLGIPLRASITNRVHPLPGDPNLPADVVERVLAATRAPPKIAAWLGETWSRARSVARAERTRLEAFAAALPAGTSSIELPELDHDAHSLDDLALLARLLGEAKYH